MIKTDESIGYSIAGMEKRYTGTVRGLQSRIRDLYSEIVKRFGDDGLALIRDVSGSYGTSISSKVRANRGDLSIEDAARFLIKVFDNVLADGEVTEWTEDRVAITVTRCPYPFTDPKICEAHTTMETALVRGLNPQLDYFIESSIPRGDKVCRHVLARKKSQ